MFSKTKGEQLHNYNKTWFKCITVSKTSIVKEGVPPHFVRIHKSLKPRHLQFIVNSVYLVQKEYL